LHCLTLTALTLTHVLSQSQPTQLGSLYNLQFLNIGGNSLSGTFPVQYVACNNGSDSVTRVMG